MTKPSLGSRTQGMVRRKDIRAIFWIWTALTVGLIFFAFVPAHLMGAPASPTMKDVEDTMTVFSIAAAPVAAVVWAVMLYSIFRWRYRGEGPPPEDGVPLRSSGPLSATWVIISTVLCVFLLIWGLAELEAVAKPAAQADPLVVNVTGQQWLWSFDYPNNGNVESDVLYLPENRPVVFHVTSVDVVHSFWVVQMGIKVDANPGEITQTSVIPNRLGTYDIRCAELCGLLHADMETTAKVVSSTDFRSWLIGNGGHL